jgi:hypothetical protein
MVGANRPVSPVAAAACRQKSKPWLMSYAWHRINWMHKIIVLFTFIILVRMIAKHDIH